MTDNDTQHATVPFRKSIVWRLQVWYAALLLLTLVAVSVSLAVQQRIEVLNRIDADLASTAEEFERSLRGYERLEASGDDPRRNRPDEPRRNSGNGRHRPTPPAQFVDRFESGKASYFEVRRNDGPIVLQIRVREPIPPFKPSERPIGHESRIRQRGSLRELALIGPSGSLVIVGRDIETELSNLANRQWQIAGTSLFVLIAALVGGTLVTRRLLAPLSRMTRTATKLSASTLSERMEVGDDQTELGRLAVVLNDALDRVETAFDRQRRFTADASHELRTPLSVIRAQIELALRKPRTVDEYRVALGICEDAVHRMDRLVSSLLLLARLNREVEHFDMKPIRLDLVIEKYLSFRFPTTEQGSHAIRTDLAPAEIVGSPPLLERVVENLLTNAISHSPHSDEVLVRCWTEDRRAVLEVTDTGEGIPEGDLPRVAERFYRADAARSSTGGAGLGLAICQEIIALHAGQLHITSALGRGTRVRVELPAAGRTAASPT